MRLYMYETLFIGKCNKYSIIMCYVHVSKTILIYLIANTKRQEKESRKSIKNCRILIIHVHSFMLNIFWVIFPSLLWCVASKIFATIWWVLFLCCILRVSFLKNVYVLSQAAYFNITSHVAYSHQFSTHSVNKQFYFSNQIK